MEKLMLAIIAVALLATPPAWGDSKKQITLKPKAPARRPVHLICVQPQPVPVKAKYTRKH